MPRKKPPAIPAAKADGGRHIVAYTPATATRAPRTEIGITPLAKMPGKHADLGGSRDDDFNLFLLGQASNAAGVDPTNEGEVIVSTKATLTGLMGFKPKDEVEGMIAAQFWAAHSATMRFHTKATEGRMDRDLLKLYSDSANKTSRTCAMLLEALSKYRGGGKQEVIVKHVHVYQGGQAIVGTVNNTAPGVGGRIESEGQPYEQRAIGHASMPEVWSSEQAGPLVPIAGNKGQKAVPSSRGSRGERSAKGK